MGFWRSAVQIRPARPKRNCRSVRNGNVSGAFCAHPAGRRFSPSVPVWVWTTLRAQCRRAQNGHKDASARGTHALRAGAASKARRGNAAVTTGSSARHRISRATRKGRANPFRIAPSDRGRIWSECMDAAEDGHRAGWRPKPRFGRSEGARDMRGPGRRRARSGQAPSGRGSGACIPGGDGRSGRAVGTDVGRGRWTSRSRTGRPMLFEQRRRVPRRQPGDAGDGAGHVVGATSPRRSAAPAMATAATTAAAGQMRPRPRR
jgi:hypothetical protein